MDLALNNLQRLIYHKTQPTNQPTKVSQNFWFTLVGMDLSWDNEIYQLVDPCF